MPGPHILLVDDHEFTLSLHKKVLSELGVTTVSEARDGSEALAKARANRPDIVISDLNMPGMDGMTFINHLAQERLADSVIIASGLAPGVLKAVVAMAVANGVRVLGALEKPLHRDALANMLYQHAHPSAGDADETKGPDAPAVERAIELGQFKAWFRPVNDVTAMHTVAAEVVPRWESPDYGITMGDDELASVIDLPEGPGVMRAVVHAAVNAGSLWQQMGWNGMLTLPSGLARVRDEALWDWIPSLIKDHGANGTVALAVDGSLFATDPGCGAFAVARAMMDGYYVIARVQQPSELDALRLIAACHVVTCPADWIDGNPAAMKKVADFASRMGAEIGVHGVSDAGLLGRLANVGVRRAQGDAIGRPASAAETYDLHLARR
ncbi:MAG: response regulator [Gemmatimonadetes bacterium]|nr:response regulator [Gemmatimonadota bacterium]